ncbi:MAG TPA: hypothetical protein VN367_07565 [Chlorobaculum sp.]|nr:hypothetical protein [Chlorobaculum sp.]
MSQEKIIIWSDTNADQERWRVDVLRRNNEGEYVPVLKSDSDNFPIDVEDFGTFEEDLLIQSLKHTFPDADISLKF